MPGMNRFGAPSSSDTAPTDAQADYLAALAAAGLAHALDDTIVVAPRFASNSGPWLVAPTASLHTRSIGRAMATAGAPGARPAPAP
jgi:hypothetical protein